MTLFVHYCWMALELLAVTATVIVITTTSAIIIESHFPAVADWTISYPRVSRILDSVVSLFLLWFAFSHWHLFWEFAAAFAVVVALWVVLNRSRIGILT